MQLSAGQCIGLVGKRTGKAMDSALQNMWPSSFPLKITDRIFSAAELQALGRYCPLNFETQAIGQARLQFNQPVS